MGRGVSPLVHGWRVVCDDVWMQLRPSLEQARADLRLVEGTDMCKRHHTIVEGWYPRNAGRYLVRAIPTEGILMRRVELERQQGYPRYKTIIPASIPDPVGLQACRLVC